MLSARRLLPLLVLFALATAAGAQSRRPAAKPADAKPVDGMTFQLVTNNPDAPPERQMRWVTAKGNIVAATPKAFEAFQKTADLSSIPIYFDSTGGSILGALQLGEMLRKANARVSVGRSTPVDPGDAKGSATTPDTATLPRHQLLPNLGQCHSSCTYAFLGGGNRTIPIGAQFGVHMFWPGDKMDAIYDRKYGYEEIERAQRVSAQIGAYIQRMGADVRMLDLASRTPPKGLIRRLTPREIMDLKIASVETGAPLFSVPPGWGVAMMSDNASLSTGGVATRPGQPPVRYVLELTCSDTRGFHDIRFEQSLLSPPSDGRLLAMRRVLLASGTTDAVIATSGKDIRAIPAQFPRLTTMQPGSWLGKVGTVTADVAAHAAAHPADGLKLVIDDGEGGTTTLPVPLANFATQYRLWSGTCEKIREKKAGSKSEL